MLRKNCGLAKDVWGGITLLFNMGLFNYKQKKDLKLSEGFQKRFNKMIIAKDKKTGYLAVLLQSKSKAMLTIKTLQKEPELMERIKDGN